MGATDKNKKNLGKNFFYILMHTAFCQKFCFPLDLGRTIIPDVPFYLYFLPSYSTTHCYQSVDCKQFTARIPFSTMQLYHLSACHFLIRIALMASPGSSAFLLNKENMEGEPDGKFKDIQDNLYLAAKTNKQN